MQKKLNDQEINRRDKLKRLQDNNQDPFAIVKFERNYNTLTFKREFDKYAKEDLHENNTKIILAGRIVAIRQTFLVLKDFYGKIQLYLNRKQYPALFKMLETDIDIGDILGVHGTPMKTNTGELTIKINNLTLLSKALKPLPEK
jgi:lysyl-tRNA synthetase class 2